MLPSDRSDNDASSDYLENNVAPRLSVATDESAPILNDPLRSLIDNMLDYAVFTTDIDGVVATWNPGVENVLGYSRNEWLGQSAAVIFTPEDRAQNAPEEEMRRARSEGRSEDIRWHVKRDGSRFWADGSMTPLYDASKNLLGYGKILRDATARKRMEEQVAASERRYSAVFNQAAAGIRLTDLTGRFVLVNDRYCETVGYSREELLGGMRMQDITHPDDLQANLSALQRLIETGEPFQTDKRYVHRSGEIIWVSSSVSLIRDADGAPQFIQALSLDITLTRRAEEALSKAEAELAARARNHAALVNTTNDSLVRYDRDLRFVFVNPAFEIATGIPYERAVGRTLREAGFPEETAAEWETVLRRVFERGEPVRMEGILTVTPGRGERAFERDIVPEFDPSGSGEVVTVLTFSRDITDRKRAEERERLLSNLTERIRAIPEPEDVLYEAAKTVGEFTHASRCLYGEIDENAQNLTVYRDFAQGDGVASIEGVYPPYSFGPPIIESLRAGHITKSEDTEADIRLNEQDRATFRALNFRAFLAAPLHKEGRWVAFLAIHSTIPKQWTTEEEELLAIVVERTWLTVENTRLYRAMQDEVEERRETERKLADAYARERARAERETLLSEASRVLSESLRYEDTLIAIARLIVPRFADWCGVDVTDARGAPQRVAVEHVNPEKAAWGWELQRRYPTLPDAPHGVAAVLRTGKSEWAAVITEEMLAGAARDEEHGRILREIGFTSAMIVPLIAGGTVFGAISFVATKESERIYTPEDLYFAEEIGRRAALAIENARLFQATQRAEGEQRRIAETLQRSLLLAPPEDAFPDLDLLPYYEAATDESLIGGDLYDVVNLGEDKIALIVGDATGKSLSAAIDVADYKFSLRAYLRLEDAPAGAFKRMNQHLLDRQTLDGKPQTGLLCCALAFLDRKTGEVQVCAAGAEPPVLYRADLCQTEEITASGPALGALPRWEGNTVTLQLGPGDILLLYTDGLTEARKAKRSPDFFGVEGVLRSFQNAARSPSLALIAERIVADAKAFASGSLGDDVCLLLAQRKDVA